MPSSGEIHTYIVASDWHSEFINVPTYNILKKFARTIPRSQRRLIINGDFLDAPYLMKKKSEFKKFTTCFEGMETYFLPYAEREFEWGNKILDEMQNLFDYIYFIGGNHCCFRYEMFMHEYCPSAYRHNFNLPLQLKFRERGIPHIKYNSWLDIGKLSITHGMFHGASALKRHWEASGGRNTVFGHVHHDDCKTFRARGDSVKSWSLPAMCDLNPDYIKNSDVNWTNGFMTINMKSNGNFNAHTHNVWDNELILPNGKLITG